MEGLEDDELEGLVPDWLAEADTGSGRLADPEAGGGVGLAAGAGVVAGRRLGPMAGLVVKASAGRLGAADTGRLAEREVVGAVGVDVWRLLRAEGGAVEGAGRVSACR